jgi:ribosomal protein L35
MYSSSIVLCGFILQTCLREHIVTHTDAKRYSCEICGKLLRNDSSYRRHMMCVHSVKQTCELCGKDIYTKTGLERHKKEVHGIMPWIWYKKVRKKWCDKSVLCFSEYFSHLLFPAQERRKRVKWNQNTTLACGKHASWSHQWNRQKLLNNNKNSF